LNEQPQTPYLASLLLGVSTKTVQRYTKAGYLRPLPRLGGVRGQYYSFREVLRFRDSLKGVAK